MRRRLVPFIAVAAAMACAASAQRPASQGPAVLDETELALTSRGVAGGERIDIPPIATTGKDATPLHEIEWPVTVDGARHMVHMTPWSIRTANARLEVIDAAGERTVDAPPASTIWLGTVSGVADSSVVASIADGSVLAIVRIGESIWTVEPLRIDASAPVDPPKPAGAPPPADPSKPGAEGVKSPAPPAAPRQHLVVANDGLAAAALQCATTDAETAAVPVAAAPQVKLAACPRELRIAVELDAAWLRRCGERRDAAIGRAELLVAWAADELARRANVLVREGVIMINERPPAVGEPPQQPPATVTAGAAYADLWARWSARTDAPSRDAIVSISGKVFADAAFGLAWTGGVAGGPAQACAVAGLGASPALGAQAAIVTHLIAHLVGAGHGPIEPATKESPTPTPDLLAPRWARPPRPLIGVTAAAQIAALVHGRGILRSPPLAPPRDVAASDGTFCGGVEVRWTPSEGAGDAVRYQILRGSTEDAAAAQPIGEVDKPPFVDADAPQNPPARYWVRATDGCRESAMIGGDAGFAPSPVTDAPQPTATDGVGCAEIVITWQPIERAAAYQVLRSGVNNVGSATPIGTSKEPRFVDGSPPAGGVLWYWVRAVDRCGALGPAGRGDSGFTGGVPPAPTGVSATDGAACGSVVITWNAVAGATSYSIWRSATTNVAEGSQIATAQSSPFEDINPPADIDLHYWVRATNGCGAGPLGGPDRGRAVTNVPRIADVPDAVVPCGQPYQSPAPTLVNADCAVPVEWRLVSGPPGVLMAADGSVSWPAPVAGTHTLVIAARNARGAGQEQWMVQVTPHAPQLAAPALPPYAGRCGEPMALPAPVIANAPCAGTVRWTLEGAPSGATVGPDGIVRWPAPTIGKYAGSLVATNAAGSASAAWQATIAPTAPRVAELKEFTTRAGSPWSGPVAVLENAACAGPIAWKLAKSPDGATIAANGAIAWPAPVAGRHDFTVRAENESGAGERSFTLVVAEVAIPAIAPIADATANCGQPWRSEPPTLANGDAAGPVRWSLAKAPTGATIDERGAVAWPTAALGEHMVTITATNAAGAGERTYKLRVGPVAPVVEPISNAQAPTGAVFVGPASTLSNAACAGTVTWKLVAGPAGATFDTDGVIRWDQPVVGVHTITVSATNAAGAGEASWTLTIVAPPP